LLFLLFINDIDCGVVNKLLKFADNNKLIGIVFSEAEVEQLRSYLKRLYDWSLDWQMLFNTQKCKSCISVTEMRRVFIHLVEALSRQRMKKRI